MKLASLLELLEVKKYTISEMLLLALEVDKARKGRVGDSLITALKYIGEDASKVLGASVTPYKPYDFYSLDKVISELESKQVYGFLLRVRRTHFKPVLSLTDLKKNEEYFYADTLDEALLKADAWFNEMSKE